LFVPSFAENRPEMMLIEFNLRSAASVGNFLSIQNFPGLWIPKPAKKVFRPARVNPQKWAIAIEHRLCADRGLLKTGHFVFFRSLCPCGGFELNDIPQNSQ